MDPNQKYRAAIRYIRSKVDELLTLMGTLPLRPEELDDDTLIDLDPIGIVAGSFRQIIEHLNQTNRRLDLATREVRAILDNIHAAVIVIDEEGLIQECNRRALDWFFEGPDCGEVVGQPLSLICSCGTEIAQACKEHDHWEQEVALHGRHYQVVATSLERAGQGKNSVVLIFDITRQKQVEGELQLYAKVFSHVGEGIVIADHETRILKVNDAYQRITGYAIDELLGQTPRMLKSGLHDAAFYAEVWADLKERGFWQGEMLDRAKSGAIIPLLQTISAVRDPRGELTHYIGVIADITPLKETQTRLNFLAHHDPLTQLPNRLLFHDRLEHAIALARREETQLGIFFIDLDRFKTINDSLGHQVGDMVLVEAAQRLQGLVRECDTVARLGGDEFVVLMEKIAAQDTALLADRILGALKLPFFYHDLELHVGCSIGITLYPDDGTDAAALLRNADTAMYRAKAGGRDAHFRYTSDLSDLTRQRLDLENALQVAVRQNRFALHYQPIVDLAGGRLRAAEALIRWPGAPVPGYTPDHFIPVAEDLRLIIPLGDWILRESLSQFRRWRDAGVDLSYISVNISAVQIAQEGFADRLTELLQEHGVAGRQLQIELTENLLMQNIGVAVQVLQRLRRLGVRVAIDDFGTGYSSLSYLKQLPIDCLKIDRSFVRDLPGDPNDSAIATAIIGLARTLGFGVVAEGIETEVQESYLAQAGCGFGQGYRYARPMAPEQFLEYTRGSGGAG